MERVDPVPERLKKKYLLRSKDPSWGLCRVVPEIRALVRFERLNLMDEVYPIDEAQSIVFCRNVMIYFDRSVQEELMKKIVRYMEPSGYLFMGHAETLFGMDLPLMQIAPSVYRRTE